MHTTLVHEETGDCVTTTLVTDGGKNTVFVVSGVIECVEDSSFDIIDVSKLSGNPPGLRLDTLTYTIESGLKLLLKYRDQPYTIPLEGRSKLDLDPVGGLAGHEIDLICKGIGAFFIVIDISKIGV
jgi:hypothetical protein